MTIQFAPGIRTGTHTKNISLTRDFFIAPAIYTCHVSLKHTQTRYRQSEKSVSAVPTFQFIDFFGDRNWLAVKQFHFNISHCFYYFHPITWIVVSNICNFFGRINNLLTATKATFCRPEKYITLMIFRYMVMNICVPQLQQFYRALFSQNVYHRWSYRCQNNNYSFKTE